MNTYVLGSLISIGLAILINTPLLLRERRFRKLTEAKLELAQTVNEMNELMLKGEIVCGDLCHDKLFPSMVYTQFDGKFKVTWQLWKRPTEESKALIMRIHKEIAAGSTLGKLLARFSKVKVKCFQRQQPLVFFWFFMWTLFCAGGFVLFLLALLSVLTARLAWRTFHQKYGLVRLKQFVGEWALILAQDPSPQFKRSSHLLG